MSPARTPEAKPRHISPLRKGEKTREGGKERAPAGRLFVRCAAFGSLAALGSFADRLHSSHSRSRFGVLIS